MLQLEIGVHEALVEMDVVDRNRFQSLEYQEAFVVQATVCQASAFRGEAPIHWRLSLNQNADELDGRTHFH